MAEVAPVKLPDQIRNPKGGYQTMWRPPSTMHIWAAAFIYDVAAVKKVPHLVLISFFRFRHFFIMSDLVFIMSDLVLISF